MKAGEMVLTLMLLQETAIAEMFTCRNTISYPEVNHHNQEYFGENLKQFYIEKDILYIYNIPPDYTSCESTKTMETCFELNSTKSHRNIYVKSIQKGSHGNTYDVISVDTYRTDEIEQNESCVWFENNIYHCCLNVTVDDRIWKVKSRKIGVAFGGTVLKPLHSVNETQMVEVCDFIYDGNVHDPINRAQCRNSTIPLTRFIIEPPDPESFALTTMQIAIISTFTAFLLLLVVIVATWIIFYVKYKKQSSSNKELSDRIYMETREYAEVGPRVYINPKDYLIKPEDDKYARFGCSSLSETEDYHIYMEPPLDETELYDHIEKSLNSLPKGSISVGSELGSGQFGKVYEGKWCSSDEGEVPVAIKTLKQEACGSDRIKFLQEGAIMAQFKDPNIVTFHGVVIDEEQIMLVLELLPNGDLRSHLLQARTDSDNGVSIDDHTLLSYCRQIVSGMTYLSSKRFIHRDLAARNVLVSVEGMCKIADFGMARDLIYDDYYTSHGGMIPVKWTAPEALHYKKYSAAGDVWSYGVVLYEIWSVGHKPFESLDNKKVLTMVDEGFRLPPPPGCPKKIYDIMIKCWHPLTSKRPSFLDIRGQLFLPDSVLLQWKEEDKKVHTEASILGARLTAARHLYLGLQNTYKKNSDPENNS